MIANKLADLKLEIKPEVFYQAMRQIGFDAIESIRWMREIYGISLRESITIHQNHVEGGNSDELLVARIEEAFGFKS